MASDMGVPFLGRLPLDPRIAKCCDEGKSFLSEVPDSPAAKAYAAIIKGIAYSIILEQLDMNRYILVADSVLSD